MTFARGATPSDHIRGSQVVQLFAGKNGLNRGKLCTPSGIMAPADRVDEFRASGYAHGTPQR